MAKKKQSKPNGDDVVDAQHLDTPRLSAHPRARRQIRAARGWAALGVFVLVQILALRAGLSVFDAGLRALEAGVVAYLVAWTAAVLIWRQLAMAEIESLRRRMMAPPEPDATGAVS